MILGGADLDAHTRMGSVVLTILAAWYRIEPGIERERNPDSVVERRTAGKDLDGRRPPLTDYSCWINAR